MNYFWISLAIMLIMLALMSVGIIFGKQPIKGSCGGLGALMGDDCEFCDDKDQCEHLKEEASSTSTVLPKHTG